MIALLQEMVDSDGHVLVMHDGDKPYFVTASGKVQPTRSPIAVDRFREVVSQLLPEHLRPVLGEVGGIEYDLPPLDEFPHEHFTVVAVFADDTVHAEIRRRIATDDLVPEELFDAVWPGRAGNVAASGALRAFRSEVGDTLPTHSTSDPSSGDNNLALQALMELWPVAAPRSHEVTHFDVDERLEGTPDGPAPNVPGPAPGASAKDPWTAERGMPGAVDIRAIASVVATAVAQAARDTVAETVPAAVAAAVPAAVAAAVANAVPSAVADAARNAVREVAAVAVAQAARDTVADAVPAAVAEVVRTAAREEVAAAVARAARETVAEAAPAALVAAVSAAVADAVPDAVIDAARIAVADLAAAVAKAVGAALAAAATPTGAQISPSDVFIAPSLSGERLSQPQTEVVPPVKVDKPSSAAVLEFAPSRSQAPSLAVSSEGASPVSRLPVHSDAAPPRAVAVRSDLERLLRSAAARRASTLYLLSNARPSVWVDGQLQTMDSEPVHSVSDVFSLLLTMMPEANRDALRTGLATEWTRGVEGIGRVKCMSFSDHNGPGGVFRMPVHVLTADQLGLTQDIQSLARYAEGLVLVVGPHSSGKQTLMSALVDLINRTRQGYIITLEDEVTIVHAGGYSVISQRQVTSNEDDVLVAARSALRENPNVLLLEEIRTGASMNLALEAASSGHLVIGGLLAHSASEAIDRIVSFYAPEHAQQIRIALAQSLRGIVAQVLLTDRRGGRVAAREVLVNTPDTAAVIASGTAPSSSTNEWGRLYGMVQLTDVLADYVEHGIVDVDEASRHVRDRLAFTAALKRRGIDSGRLAQSRSVQ
jgi:twitching motility protein PilT